MKISVNILCWNTVKTLIETLKIVSEDLKHISSEIIVVDNGSNDGTREVMEEMVKLNGNPSIKYIVNSTNLGISKGKNQGIDASTGDYIMLVDGDIVPVPNSINCLSNYLDNHPDDMAIGFLPNKFTNAKNKNGAINHEVRCNILDPIEEHKGHCVYYGMYRREVWDKIHFDETFGVGYGYEDLDTYMQMEKLGIKQLVAGINFKCGKYYHEINSSIRQMGFEKYMSTSMQRSKVFKSKWEGVNVVH